MTGPAWLVLPTFNEAENLETVVAAARRVLGEAAPEGFRVLVVDDDSPDGTGAMADELAAAHPGEVEVLHRPVREGLGPAYLAGFERALVGRRGLRVRDGRRPLARPGGPRAPARRRARRRRRPRAGLALRARRRRRRLGRHPAHRQPRRVVVRAARPGPAGARPHGRLQVLSGRRAARDRPAQRPLARLRLPGRADLPHHRARAARGRGADRLPRPRAGDVEDVLADHRRGGVARAAAAPGRRAPPTSGREPSRRRRRRAESTQGERQRARPRPGHG